MIEAGRVKVDGVPAALGTKVDPAVARVTVDGLPLPVNPVLVYYLLHKPVGVISSRSDPHDRRTVVDLVPSEPPVYPVGRLDGDSEGLLLITNDGDLTHALTHPKHEVSKTYAVLVSGRVTSSDVRRLVAGIELEDGFARARSARIIDQTQNETLVEVVMTEGRNREVRRLMDRIGHRVERLVRTAIGPLRDRSLQAGEWRLLTVREIRALYDAAATPWQDDGDHPRNP